jgi:hypothetical protein
MGTAATFRIPPGAAELLLNASKPPTESFGQRAVCCARDMRDLSPAAGRRDADVARNLMIDWETRCRRRDLNCTGC